jgi:hypothetical protein
LVHPFEQIFEVVEPALPEPCHLACPPRKRSMHFTRLRCAPAGSGPGET